MNRRFGVKAGQGFTLVSRAVDDPTRKLKLATIIT